MSVPSVQIAKDRLHTLLSADRIECTPDITEQLSTDISQLISKYMELNSREIEVQIHRSEILIRYTGEKD